MTIYTSIKSAIETHKDELCEWLTEQEKALDLPLYTSVDIRDAGFKLSVVDTNLFPAGFNNLCDLSLKQAEPALKEALLKRAKDCKSILIISEEHTRNKWYLENIWSIKTMIENVGVEVKIASPMDKFEKCDDGFDCMSLETALGHELCMYSLEFISEKIAQDTFHCDLILLNNDLSTGVPEGLKKAKIPIFPNPDLGWHKRKKSTHFEYANQLITEFAAKIKIDPWLMSAQFSYSDAISIQDESDREKLAAEAEKLIKNIQQKYDEHDIKEKPFIFLKANSGTYGMGVLPIENPADIIELNRKGRNKLAVGKQSQGISSFILQEGVPSVNEVNDRIAEACIYSIANQFVGGFYRTHDAKGTRDNLNAKGMRFIKMCTDPLSECVLKKTSEPNPLFQACGMAQDVNLDIYRILAKLSGLAAGLENKALRA